MKELIAKLREGRSRYGNPSMLEDKIDMIKGRMSAENNIDFSDSEIERCLSECVGGHFLVPLAKELRNQKLLSNKLCEECRQEEAMDNHTWCYSCLEADAARREAIEDNENENCGY